MNNNDPPGIIISGSYSPAFIILSISGIISIIIEIGLFSRSSILDILNVSERNLKISFLICGLSKNKAFRSETKDLLLYPSLGSLEE